MKTNFKLGLTSSNQRHSFEYSTPIECMCILRRTHTEKAGKCQSSRGRSQRVCSVFTFGCCFLIVPQEDTWTCDHTSKTTPSLSVIFLAHIQGKWGLGGWQHGLWRWRNLVWGSQICYPVVLKSYANLFISLNLNLLICQMLMRPTDRKAVVEITWAPGKAWHSVNVGSDHAVVWLYFSSCLISVVLKL